MQDILLFPIFLITAAIEGAQPTRVVNDLFVRYADGGGWEVFANQWKDRLPVLPKKEHWMTIQELEGLTGWDL
jgi:hypothetical protein